MAAVSPRTNEPGVLNLPSVTEVEPATKDISQRVEQAVAPMFATIDGRPNFALLQGAPPHTISIGGAIYQFTVGATGEIIIKEMCA